MKKTSLERLYQESAELTPRDGLKSEILTQTKQELASHQVRNEMKKATKKTRRKRRIWQPLVACFVAIVLVLGTFIGFYHEGYQTVYVDVNPSISLEINRFGQVNDVEYLNEDAAEALAGVKLEGKQAEKALEKILKAYTKAGYFDTEAEIMISAIAKNKKTDKLLEKLQKCAEKVCSKNCTVSISKCTKEEKKEANKQGMSAGKYKIISQIIEKYPYYSLEYLRDKSMKELKDLLQNG